MKTLPVRRSVPVAAAALLAIAAGSAVAATGTSTTAAATNVAGTSVATASSQNTSTGQTASKAIDGSTAGYPTDYTKEWATTGGKAGSWLKLTWSSPQSISQVVLYDRPNLDDQITGGRLSFSDGTTVNFGALNNNGSAVTVSFPAKTVTSVTMTATAVSSTTKNIGLAEIMAYGTSTTTSSTTTSTSPSPSPSPTSTSTATPASSSSPSGEAMPVGDLPGWKQIFADDFAQDVPVGSFPSAVSNKWWAYPDGWKDTSKNGTYYPSKVLSQKNGLLNMYIHTENGVHMVAAPVPILPGTSAGKGQLYGRYVVRFKADPIIGYKTAWLLWPDSEVWPRDGEIDFPEGNLNSTISAFMHRQGATSGSDQDAYSTGVSYTSWHTAVIEWLPSRCTFILDGKVIGNSTSRIPNTAMHWVLQTESWLSSTPPPDSSAGNVQVDWVAIYKPV